MRINADFDQAAHVAYCEAGFVPSPMVGVERLMLDRIGEEVARATSLVRYAPESRFSAHTHDGGEEFMVLDGVFSDATGDYGPGTYVRNPIGTSHAPWSDAGCLIFVKLHQFDERDSQQFQTDTENGYWVPNGPGCHVQPLHAFGTEDVRLYKVDAGAGLNINAQGGAEILIVTGSAVANETPMTAWDWMRFPDGAIVDVRSAEGTTVFVKTGHLAAKT